MSDYCETIPYRGMIRNRKPDPRRYWYFLLGLVIALLFIDCSIFVWSRVRIINLRYLYTQLRDDEGRAMDQYKKLKVELATLTSLKQVERVGKEQLGMVKPSPKQVVILAEKKGQ